MKIAVLNADGKEIATRDVLAAWEHRAVQPALLHQAVVTAAANARRPWAHTKGRGDVRGGGRKPWKQKGTGRARHGSIRSPIWKGGGVTFGPTKDRTYARRLPAKMRQGALGLSLAAKVRAGEVVLLEQLPDTKKTKAVAALLSQAGAVSSRLVVAPQAVLRTVAQGTRNLPRTAVRSAEQLTAADALAVKQIVATMAAWDIVERRLAAGRVAQQEAKS